MFCCHVYFAVFVVNFEHIRTFSSVSIVDFEQVNVLWNIHYCEYLLSS